MSDFLCNINFFLYPRLVFGYYHEFQTTKRIRWLVRFYCCLVAAYLFISSFQFLDKKILISNAFILTMTEYVLYVIISLVKNNQYLLQYYKKIPLIDSMTIQEYKPMRRGLMGYLMMLFIIKLLFLVKFFVFHTHVPILRFLLAGLEMLMWYAIVLGRLPVVFVFALLYTRVKLMRKTLEKNDFDCRNQGRHHPRQYILMYEAIHDRLEESNATLNLQLLVSVVLSTIISLIYIMYCLHIMRDTDGTGNLDLNAFLYFLFETSVGLSPLFVSAVLADMVTMEVEEIMSITLERRITCNNERHRAEIDMLFQLVKGRPIEYSLGHAVPLNVRALLTFMSFAVTTIIAILQIRTISSNT